MSENNTALSDQTRHKLKTLSKSLLNLHKILLDSERADYEKQHGKIESVQAIFQLVLENPHFAWLRVLSGEIVLIDEFLADKTAKKESEGIALLNQTKQLLSPENLIDPFDKSLQIALSKNDAAFVKYNETLMMLE